MQTFINEIVNFILSIRSAIAQKFLNTSSAYFDNYLAWLDKNIFTESSWIGINITYSELFTFLGTWILVIFFIILFVKFIIKILGIFRTRFND